MTRASATASALLLLASPLLGQSSPLFGEPTPLQGGDQPSAVVVADFDGNGQRDLAVANEIDGTVCILMGLSQGQFGPPLHYRTGLGPRAMAQGDLDLDGATDLVTADHGGNTVTVLLGRGDGTFAAPASYPIGKLPNSVAVEDVTDDGWLDVVVCCTGTLPDPSPAVFVAYGLGGGLLGVTPGFMSGLLPWHAAVANLDGDGLPDIVTCNSGDDSLFVWLNQKGGHFFMTHAYPALAPTSTLPVDIGGDGDVDLVVSGGLPALSVYGGADDGTFDAPIPFLLAGIPEATASADLNHDGLPDVVATVPSAVGLQALFGQEADVLSAAKTYATGGLPGALALGDLDGDGWPDAVVALPGADSVALLRNLEPKDPWTDMGFAVPAAGGPVLTGLGTLRPGSAGLISLAQAAPHAPAVLSLSTTLGVEVFACGALLAVPTQRQWVVTTDASGQYLAGWAIWPAGLGLEQFVLQCTVLDPQAPCGMALSNALKAEIPD